MQTRLGRYLAGKHIFLKTGMYGLRVTKHYKVMEYDLDAKKYTVIDWEVDGPIEYIEILDEKNIEVYVEVIPVEESSEEEEEESTPFTAEDIRTMNYKKLKALCAEHKMFTKEWPGNYAKVPEMKEALMEKFGLEGSTLSDRDLKIEETNNAMAAFLKLANVLAIISNIRGFDPKNTAHAQSFMNEYRKQNGNGTIRSRKCT